MARISYFVSRPSGFTLIETFVAITILMLAIVGPLSIASQGVNAATTGSDQITATFLSQDAIEYLRWVRDTNKLISGNGWLGGLATCASPDGSATCRFDVRHSPYAMSPVSCSDDAGGVCIPLHYNAVSHFYDYNLSDPVTKFTRSVSIKYPVGGNDCTSGHGCEAEIKVTLSWVTGGLAHHFEVRENIMDWQ